MLGRATMVLVAGCSGPEGGRGSRRVEVETDAVVEATVEPHGVVVCADPDERDRLGPFERRELMEQTLSVRWTWGSGLMVGDLDGDGDLDALAPVEDGVVRFDGGEPAGELVEDALRTADPALATFGSGGSLADYDGDGDLDVYVTRVTGDPAPPEADGRNLLLRNDGDGGFTDVTDEAGVTGCGPHHRTGLDQCWRSMASAWADVDLDGDLDLWVGNYGWVDHTEGVLQDAFEPGEPDFLYLNEGDGTFTEADGVFPPEVQDGYTYAGGFHDLDGDLDPDLYVVNDFGNKFPNRVLWNEDGRLVFDPLDATGLAVPMTGMGLAAGDLNGDGWLDLAVPQWKKNVLLESAPDLGVWIDATAIRGVQPDLQQGQHVGWGGELGDLDLDGDLDLVVQYGHLWSTKDVWRNDREQPDGVYLAEPDPEAGWAFVDRAPGLGMVDVGAGRGALLVDLDRDGGLDLFKRSLFHPDTVYLSRCGTAGWLEVHLRWPGTMNTFAVGARVEIEDGGERWTRHVYAGGTSYASGGPPEVHFGLGERDRIERITVYWPDGVRSEITDVETRQQVTITR